MNKVLTLLIMLVIGFSSAFGLQSAVNVNLNTWYGFASDLQAPYDAKVQSDEYKNSLINAQLINAAKYLLTLGYSWITPQNAIYVAEQIWGAEIRAEVAKVEGEPMNSDNGSAPIGSFLYSKTIFKVPQQSITYKVGSKPSYIAGAQLHTVYDITNLRLPIKLETSKGISTKQLVGGITQYTIKPMQTVNTWKSYNQVLCVKTGVGLLSSLQSSSLTSTYKAVPSIAYYTVGISSNSWSATQSAWDEPYTSSSFSNASFYPTNVANYNNHYISKYRVMAIRGNKNEFYYTPDQYNTACAKLPILIN